MGKSNPRPSACKADALPTELIPMSNTLGFFHLHNNVFLSFFCAVSRREQPQQKSFLTSNFRTKTKVDLEALAALFSQEYRIIVPYATHFFSAKSTELLYHMLPIGGYLSFVKCVSLVVVGGGQRGQRHFAGVTATTLPQHQHRPYCTSSSFLLHNTAGALQKMMMSNSSSNDNSTPSSTNSIRSIREQKQVLRKRIRSKLKLLSTDDIQIQSQQVWDHVCQQQVWKDAKSVGLFLSMPTGEICTDLILKQALEDGKDIYVPQVGQDFQKCEMDMLKVVVNMDDDGDGKNDNNILFYESWPKNKWQIPEPPDDMPRIIAQQGDIDLLIVPGLAFDCSGNRLGQGKGYYDRFIEKMTTTTDDDDGSSSNRFPLLAVGLQPQLLDENETIPVDEYDIKMDMIVLPDTIIQNKN